MSQNIYRARASIKARWLAANRRALLYQKKAGEATKEAAALQKALDALENASGGMVEVELPAPRRRSGRPSEAVLRIIAELKSKGSSTAPELAKTLGMSYWSILSYLKRGPFKSESGGGNGSRPVLIWTVAEEEPAPVEQFFELPAVSAQQ